MRIFDSLSLVRDYIADALSWARLSSPTAASHGSDFVEDITKIAVFSVGVLLALRFGTYWYRRPHELVFSGINNAVGNSALDPIADHTSHIARLRLMEELRIVDRNVKLYTTGVGQLALQAKLVALPHRVKTISESTSELSSSLASVTPDAAKTLVPLLSSLFPPQITQATGFIETIGPAASDLCLTFEVIQVGQSHPPATCSIWSSGGTCPSAPRPGRPNQTQSANSQSIGPAPRAFQVGQAAPRLQLLRRTGSAAIKQLVWISNFLLRFRSDAQHMPSNANLFSGPGTLPQIDVYTELRGLTAPAARWLAIEFWKIQTLAISRRFRIRKWRSISRSEVHNICGLMYHAAIRSGRYSSHTQFFIDASRLEFNEAIAYSPRWPFPYENLGSLNAYILTHSELEAELKQELIAKTLKLFDDAASLYAFKQMHSSKHRAFVSRALTLLQHRDSDTEAVTEAQTAIKAAICHLQRGGLAGNNVRALFDLAAASAKLSELQNDTITEDLARRLLGYALTRSLAEEGTCRTMPFSSLVEDQKARIKGPIPRSQVEHIVFVQTWQQAEQSDSPFEYLRRTREMQSALERLKSGMLSTFESNPDLPCLPFKKLTPIIDRVMYDAKWTSSLDSPFSCDSRRHNLRFPWD